jgi:hypothetical protein
MGFGVFMPMANDGGIMSGASPECRPTFELYSEICTGSLWTSALPPGWLQLNRDQPDYSPTVTEA